MKKLYDRYKRYSGGGNIDLATGIGQGGAILGEMADVFGPPNAYGKKPLASNLLSGAGRLAAVGSTFGPVGAAVGAGLGLVTGFLGNKAQKKQAEKLKAQEQIAQTQFNQQVASARIGSDPSIISGNLAAGYYALGGMLHNISDMPSQGSSSFPLSSTAAQFIGPSHAAGGVQIPEANAEVEGSETSEGNYIFSEKLGYAQLHRPIAKAIGKIEKKALSPERKNALDLLRSKITALKNSQELHKAYLSSKMN